MKTTKVIVSGQVQGVGFRWGTYKIAHVMGVKGFVMNQPDGTVLIHAQAPQHIIKSFLSDLNRGPTSYSDVQEMQVKDIDEQPYDQFTIIR